MSQFKIDRGEMDNLSKALDCLCDDYDDVDIPKRPPWPFGNPTNAVAYEAFTKDASERTEALSDWCDDTSDAVSDTSKMAEATDDEWAREFTFEAEKFQ